MKQQTFTLMIPSPIGPLRLTATAEALLRLDFADGETLSAPAAATPLLRQATDQLEEYFSGQRQTFSVPLAPMGTPFQRLVWRGLLAIPYGETVSYAGLAAAIGRPTACRAVGMANHRNPLSLFIPCHRVINADGTLGGYGGGVEKKQYLLDLEQGRLRF